MRRAAEVPFPILTQVVGLVERHVQSVESAGIQNVCPPQSEDVESGHVPELLFRLHLWDSAPNDDITVKLNDRPLDGSNPGSSYYRR